MSEEYVTKAEFDQFTKHAQYEHDRYERKIERIENTVNQLFELTASVKSMTASLDMLTNEMREHSERLNQIEKAEHTVERIYTSIKEMDTRIDSIEREPLEIAKQNAKTIKNACLAAVATAVASGLFWILINQLAMSR